MAESYKWIVTNLSVQRQSDGAGIPNDMGNRDWKAFQEWLLTPGNVPGVADPPLTPAVILANEIAAAVDLYLNSAHPILKVQRGAALVTMDELNLLRQWLVLFKATVAVASTLADLKTGVATLPNMPDRVATQIRTAIQTKITSGAGN